MGVEIESRAASFDLVCVVAGGMPGTILERLRSTAPDIRFAALPIITPDERARAEVLFAWDFREPVDATVGGLPALRWIHAASAGVEHILRPSVADRGIAVSNSAGVFDAAVAEYVLALVLAHAKGLLETASAQAERRWAYRETLAIAGATMVVIGAGRIGRAVARLASAAGMRVVGVRRAAGSAADGPFQAVVSVGELPHVAGSADYLAVTVAGTPRTRHLIGAHVIERMKPSAYLINVARGSVVDSAALAEALRAGRLAGAALDVFDDEPLPRDDPLWTVPNLLISPHMSGDAVGWADRVLDVFVENLSLYRVGKPLATAIDHELGY